ncbi:hypothetical protein N8I74_16785 [Chitiniphilus purpureus]|uniref:DUF4148 domain-containing protein n=1 Tax=Chitiniphilus purpureus TaxID=2981137 RepID=A0ABY6DKS4_9NEIS|nr:hypothetical protein [Chitiniphilus sp. CD1]UXY14955.1 hypothetical protein N8I74_16785 [Chitiniphilus sp. CD1]
MTLPPITRILLLPVLTLATAATFAATPPGEPEQTLPYQSVFDSYRVFHDQAIADWRLANRTVGEIGGWRAYAREAQGAARTDADQPGAVDAQADDRPHQHGGTQ